LSGQLQIVPLTDDSPESELLCTWCSLLSPPAAVFFHTLDWSSAPRSAIDFFTGGAVLLNAMGAHSIALEMMDAMQKSSQYIPAYFGGWCWTALLVLPHSIAVNYAFPHLIGSNGGC